MLEKKPGPIRWRKEQLSESRELFEAAAREKGGPLGVMILCERGKLGGGSCEVMHLFESYLKARKLDHLFKVEFYGYLKPAKDIRDELEMVAVSPADPFSTRERWPEERVDFVVPLYHDRPPNVETALLMCRDPKPVLLHNPFPDSIEARYHPENYLKIIGGITERLREKLI
jgi:hypothetical protein